MFFNVVCVSACAGFTSEAMHREALHQFTDMQKCTNPYKEAYFHI